jgi:bla regulator protein blaR1
VSAQGFFIGFFANMAWASLAMLLVLALRRPAARWLGAGTAYALWLLVALRLAAPPLPSLAPELALPLEPLILVVPLDAPAAPESAVSWLAILTALWAVGASLFLAWQWLAYRRFLTELSLGARSLGAYRGLPLVESAAVEGPLALGLLDRRIVVPADFAARYSPEERRLALDHEWVHHRRGDLWWNHLGLIVLALNWFNPLAWLAFRAFRADQELACDAAVTASADPAERHDYARALIKSACPIGLIAACPLNHAGQLKRRLKMMKTHRNSRLNRIGGAAAILMLAGASLALGTPGFAQAGAEPKAAPEQGEPGRERRVEHVIIHRDGDGGGHRAHAEGGDRRVHRVIVRNREGGEGQNDRDVRVHADHMRHGDGHQLVVAHCGDGRRSEVNEANGNGRTRVVVCNRSDASPAQMVEHLERARERLAGDSELSSEQRTRVTAALDREIARLRGQ